MPSFQSPPTHTKTNRLFRRKSRSYTRPTSVKLSLVSSVERVEGASRAVHYGDRFPGAFGDGARGREGCCCYPATDATAFTSEEEENLLVQLFEHRTETCQTAPPAVNRRYDLKASLWRPQDPGGVLLLIHILTDCSDRFVFFWVEPSNEYYIYAFMLF